jgi:hypothetical protein
MTALTSPKIPISGSLNATFSPRTFFKPLDNRIKLMRDKRDLTKPHQLPPCFYDGRLAVTKQSVKPCLPSGSDAISSVY